MFRKIISFIAMHNEHYCISRIEKALGFKLQAWEIDYIFDRSDYMPKGRGIGKTTMVTVKACLDYTAKDIRLWRSDSRAIRRFMSDDPDVNLMRPSYMFDFIKETYEKLENAKIKMRNITFAR